MHMYLFFFPEVRLPMCLYHLIGPEPGTRAAGVPILPRFMYNNELGTSHLKKSRYSSKVWQHHWEGQDLLRHR